MQRFKHQFILALIALAFAAWSMVGFSQKGFFASFFSEESFSSTETSLRLYQEDGENFPEIALGDIQNTFFDVPVSDSSDTMLAFPGNSIVRIFPGSKVRLQHSFLDKSYFLEILSGKIWVNTRFSQPELSVKTETMTIKPSFGGGVFALAITPEQTSLIVFRNALRFSYGNSDQDLLVQQDQALRLNHQDVRAHPEFESISSSDLNKNDWFQKNHLRDDQYHSQLIEKEKNSIAQKNLSFSNTEGWIYDVRKKLYDTGSLFTLNSSKKLDRERSFVLGILDDAFYFLKNNDKSEAQKRLSLFYEYVENFSEDEVFQSVLLDRFYHFQVFEPRDGSLFELRNVSRNVLFDFLLKQKNSFDQSLSLLRTYLFDARLASSFDSFLAQDLLRSYFKNFSRLSFSQEFLMGENELLDALILSDPVFYKDNFFAEKEKMQLAFANNDEVQKKLHESHVSLLKRLRLYFFTGKVSLDDARSIAFRLGKDAQGQEDFLSYLASEYPGSTLYGQTQKERFSAYQKFVQDQAEFSRFQQDLLVSTPENVQKVQDVLKKVESIFIAAGFKDIVIGNLVDVDQRFVPIEKASFGDIIFSGIYDIDQDLLSEIELEGQPVLENGIKLDKVSTLLQPQKADSSISLETDKIISHETKSEKVAKIVLSEKLQSYQFEFQPSQIQTANFNKKQFYIFGALLPHGKEKIFTNFRYDMNTNKVDSIVVKTLKGPLQMDVSVDVLELAVKIREFYDKNFFEQVEKELAK